MTACAFPGKTAYENRAAAFGALRRMPRFRKRQGLNPYHCPACGAWHLGRKLRRSAVAWRADP